MKVEVYGCREKDMNLISEARACTKRVEIETASQLSVTADCGVLYVSIPSNLL